MTRNTKRRFARCMAGLVVTTAAVVAPIVVLAKPAAAVPPPCAYVEVWLNNVPHPAGLTCSGFICDNDSHVFGGWGVKYSYCVI
jgi:hypothetical protein